ncbi:MAG: hypothetical protein ACKOB1_03690 [Planctomycetia bacterium]
MPTRVTAPAWQTTRLVSSSGQRHYNNGIQRRLTDVHGHVIREILS